MKFTKMQGLGNDFIIIEDMNDKYKDYVSIAVNLCDRHFGVGADGILVVKKSYIADSKMLIINSDGSMAEMCGNGIRCFAKYLFDKNIIKNENIDIETLDGIKDTKLYTQNGICNEVKVNMGKPNLKTSMIPSTLENAQIIDEAIIINNSNFRITSMLMGVPHTVLFVNEIDDKYSASIGHIIEKSKYFPLKTNVNFVKVLNSNEFEVKTWERGAGLTLACGTGACASLVACVLNGKTERKAIAHLYGGEMELEWDISGEVYMKGPAVTVFEGEYFIKI